MRHRSTKRYDGGHTAACKLGGIEQYGDTIVAPITALGRGAIAVIRLSGEEAHAIAGSLCPAVGGEARHAYYSSIIADGAPIDDGLCTLFEKGASYTGEPVAEISCHGSPHIVSEVVSEAIRLGARMARPGEFTERAFLNGNMDLSQAESVRETVESVTAKQAVRSGLLRSGALFEKVQVIEFDIARATAAIEAVVDFSEDVGDLDRGSTLAALSSAREKLEALLAGVPISRLIRNGLRIALVGRPNVGKSSLLNALVGTDRAIVTDIPGTTRDTIEEAVSIGGYPVIFIDTAGMRETDDPIEAIGVGRSREAIANADVVFLVFEAHRGIIEGDTDLANTIGRDVQWIANKSDLGEFQGDALRASALQEGGVQRIADWIAERFQSETAEPLANDRHEPDLHAAMHAVIRASETLQNESLPVDLACVDLYDALDRLGRVTGRSAPDEVIQRIFAEFCIGK